MGQPRIALRSRHGGGYGVVPDHQLFLFTLTRVQTELCAHWHEWRSELVCSTSVPK